MIPYKKNEQWWCEGKPYVMFVCSEEEKKEYVESQLGRVGERLKPSDCKSDADGYVGSNPTPSTNLPNM